MKTTTMVKSLIETSIIRNVNSACFCYFHQSKLPKGAEKFKK